MQTPFPFYRGDYKKHLIPAFPLTCNDERDGTSIKILNKAPIEMIYRNVKKTCEEILKSCFLVFS